MRDTAVRMQPGEVIGERFVVEALAGAGGMGAVYRARDRRTDEVVAIKVLTGEGGALRFEQEARVLAELDHPAIVRYVSHGETRHGRPFLAMEWLEGEDLRTALARQPLSIEQTLLLARRVTEALAAAHARGVVHRDVKPGNVFLPGGDPSRTKVLDFGIARTHAARALDSTVAPITRTGMVVGTVGYMAPEQARGSRDLDARTDLFALGCVLFECLTGRPAFSGPNPLAVLAKVLLEEAPRARRLASHVPAALDDLLARLLAKEPDARPRDAAMVLRALEAHDTGPASSSGASDREQRLVTIVLVRNAGAALDDAVGLDGGVQLLELTGQDSAVHAAARALSVLREHPGASLAIATGRVREDGALGPIIDRVASLSAQGPGVAIDELSASLLGDRFVVEGAMLRGAARASAPRTLLGKRTPYVGRDKELSLLEGTFRECLSEPIARCVLVTGVAGSGKSRLAHELLGKVRDEATVLIARGDPVGAGSALGVARQLVRDAAGLAEGEPLAAQRHALRRHLERFFAGEALDRAAEMLGELVAVPVEEPSPQLRAAREDARVLTRWLTRAFEEWIAALADAGPVLCVVEDLHWGDGASIGLLNDVLRANAGRPLMVLALARPEIHDMFPGLWARVGVQEIKLLGLTRRAVERLVTSVLGDVDASVAARVVARSDGNAFHVEELIRHVAERGHDSPPDTVLALAEGRLSRLEPDARRYLRAASVFGESFPVAGVSAILDAAQPDVAPSLVEREILILSGREGRFRHGLLRDAAYAMLADADRTALHRAAGEWLERVGETDALVLAEHFERGGAPERAAPCFLRAARSAGEMWNVSGARSLAERAERCRPSGPVLGAIYTLRALYDSGSGAHREAAVHAKKAYALLPPRSTDWYAAGAVALSSGIYTGDIEAAPQIIQDLLLTEPDGQPTAMYAYAIHVATDILDSIGQGEASEALLSRGGAHAAGSADPLYVAHVAYTRAAMAMRRDRPLGEVIAALDGAEALLRDAGPAWIVQMFKFGEALIAGEHFDLRTARARLLEALREVGDAPLFAAWASIHLGYCDLHDGRYEEALAWLRKAYELDPHHAYAAAAWVHLLRGDLSEAERLSARSLRGIDDGVVTPWVVGIAHGVGALVALRQGQHEDAERLSSRACTPCAAPPSQRSFVGRVRIDVLRARGEDVRALIDAYLERVERHARSLDPERAASYRAIPDHVHVRELAQR